MLLRHSIDGVPFQFDGLKELLAKATAAWSRRWLGTDRVQACRLEAQRFFERHRLACRVEGFELLN